MKRKTEIETGKIKKNKTIIFKIFISLILLSVFIICSGIGLITLSNIKAVPTNTIGSKIVYKMFPKKITDESLKIDFYIEFNDDFDSKNDQPIDAYKIYYISKQNKKVYLRDGIYESKDGTQSYVMVGFLLGASKKATELKAILGKVVLVYFAILLVFMVLLYYESLYGPISFKKKDDLEIE